jgi:curved DNA-binding protein CbpA
MIFFRCEHVLIFAHLQYFMSIYFNRLSRHVTGSVEYTGRSFSCYCIIHRRFYADKKSPLNHYDILGVSSNASAKDVKTAFYKLSKKFHPDVNPEDNNAANKFSTISNAYDILGDPVKRRDYDSELSSRTTPSDPYVTYDRTSSYAQRARAHRPSSWKPPPSPSSSNGGFRGAENAFGSSRSTSYGTFDKEQYDEAFGRYRGPSPRGRSDMYDFDEFYRAHYSDFKNWSTSRKQAQEKVRREQQDAENKRQEKANRSTIAKLSSIAIWLSVGIVVIFTSTLLHDMHFQQPSDELRSKFYIIPKPSKNKPSQDSSSKP